METNKEFDHREFDDLCYHSRKRIRSLPLNDQYTQTIDYNGRLYHYDPDFDCFYPHVDWDSMSHWDKYGWMYVTVVLCLIAVYIEYVR